jgi:hypothetical protein
MTLELGDSELTPAFAETARSRLKNATAFLEGFRDKVFSFLFGRKRSFLPNKNEKTNIICW